MRVADRPISEYSQKDLARLLAYVPQAGDEAPPFTIRGIPEAFTLPLSACIQAPGFRETAKAWKGLSG